MLNKLEPVLLLLTFLLLFFTGALFFAEHFFMQDAQLFQVLSSLITGFAGALLMRVKIKSDPGDTDHVDVPGAKMTAETPSGTVTMEAPKT